MKGRKGEGRLSKSARWLTRNGDGLLALLVASAVGILAILDVLGSDQLNAAILLVLALLATTLLRDRQRAKRLAAEGAAVRQVDAFDANQERVMACLTTRSWEYRGAIGDVLRKVTLPACVEASSEADLSVRIEILDPDDEALCSAYAQHRALLATGAERDDWTVQRTREEVLATVFAACWYRHQHRSLDIRVGLSSVLHTLCWDRSTDRMIITQDGSAGYALIFDKDRPYFDAFGSELTHSFLRTRQLPINETGNVPLPAKLRGADIRAVFERLGIDVGAYADRDLVEIGRSALKENETNLSALRARVARNNPDPVLDVRWR